MTDNMGKVLFITRKYPPQAGGMESYSYNLIENYNYKKKVIALSKSQIHLIWFFPWCLLYVILNAKKFEIIQLGDLLLCGIGWVAKRINPLIKVVITVHGLDITYNKKIYQYYLKHFSYGFDVYVPNSSYTNSIALERGYKPTKIICPATLTEQRFSKIEVNRTKFCMKYHISPDSIILCTTGRLVKRKGVKWFIESVLPTLSALDICYLIVGTGPMQEEIEQTVLKMKEKRVRLLGRVNDEELDNIYVHTDIFVMPNIYVENDVEGYGMVAVEAAAAKCIVVASRMQGIEDAVVEHENGIFVEPENAESFASSIRRIVDSIEEYQELAANAREYVLKECTGKAVAEKYANLFKEIVVV